MNAEEEIEKEEKRELPQDHEGYYREIHLGEEKLKTEIEGKDNGYKEGENIDENVT